MCRNQCRKHISNESEVAMKGFKGRPCALFSVAARLLSLFALAKERDGGAAHICWNVRRDRRLGNNRGANAVQDGEERSERHGGSGHRRSRGQSRSERHKVNGGNYPAERVLLFSGRFHFLSLATAIRQQDNGAVIASARGPRRL